MGDQTVDTLHRCDLLTDEFEIRAFEVGLSTKAGIAVENMNQTDSLAELLMVDVSHLFLLVVQRSSSYGKLLG